MSAIDRLLANYSRQVRLPWSAQHVGQAARLVRGVSAGRRTAGAGTPAAV